MPPPPTPLTRGRHLWRISDTASRNDVTRDSANHEHDIQDFYHAVKAGDFPAVSHQVACRPGWTCGLLEPLDEQTGVVDLVNFIEQQPAGPDTATVLTYDDSDGWYDHGFTAPKNPSYDKIADQLDGPGKRGCGTPLPGIDGYPVNGRCGLGPGLSFLAMSPWASSNYIGHTGLNQASVIRFIEDNWLGGERLGEGSFDATAGSIMDMFDFTPTGGKTAALRLDPGTGEVLTAQ